jgi:excisionase family DNA binding protein
MAEGLQLEALLDALAERVAEKVRAKLAQDGGRIPIRPRLLSIEQAAVYLGRTKEAMQHLVACRKLPVVRDGRRVFLDVRDLDHWIENHTEPAEDLTRRAA